MKKIVNDGKQSTKSKMEGGMKKKIVLPKINGKTSAFDKF
jgi:hypothetical protein